MTTLRSAARRLCVALLAALAPAARAQQNPDGLAKPGTSKVEDAMTFPAPDAIKLGGLLGDRYRLNWQRRLARVDETDLLAGFRNRPGKQAWIGEHVGKWLHAASLSFANAQDQGLRDKLDRVAAELIKTQEPDGYLGTYIPSQRFGQFKGADWDVWVHKYDLIGLLAYYQYTGNAEALEAARRVGDLLLATFGPGKKSILSAGTHVGMAATSVLEPMVLLYRATGEAKYLDFAKYIVNAWEEPGGPKIISTLMREKSVVKTANAKAYEMLSNLNGLCELYRATGERKYLEPVLIAWSDIAKNRLYLTGTGSSHEHWLETGQLPNGTEAEVGETCVTVTWMQLNLQLLRLLGEPRFADQIEISAYNHLLGAQRSDGEAWCYYTPLEGAKRFGDRTNCCLSSGPRGVALLPEAIFASRQGGVAINLYTPVRAVIPIGGSAGGSVEIEQRTEYPLSGKIELDVTPKSGPDTFTLFFRVPEWANGIKIESKAAGLAGKPAKPGEYASIQAKWKAGDTVDVEIDFSPRTILGTGSNEGRMAAMFGPLALAADGTRNPDTPSLKRIGFAADDPGKFALERLKVTDPVWETDGFEAKATGSSAPMKVRLAPFYMAGAEGGPIQVWLRRPGAAGKPAPKSDSLFALGEESRSRAGNSRGSINDGSPKSFVVTFNGGRAEEDWYAISIEEPVTINRVVYMHGDCFHNGGWFDTSKGKPRIQGRKVKDGPWIDLATLDSYPETTGRRRPVLADGQAFSVSFPAVSVCAIRVLGRPASGDEVDQRFSSCAELQAFFDQSGKKPAL